jgi:hypothetical protein
VVKKSSPLESKLDDCSAEGWGLRAEKCFDDQRKEATESWQGRIIGAESWGFVLAGLPHEFKAFRN